MTSTVDSDAATTDDSDQDAAAAADTSTKSDTGGQVAPDAGLKDAGPDTALPSEKVVVGSSTAGTSCGAVSQQVTSRARHRAHSATSKAPTRVGRATRER